MIHSLKRSLKGVDHFSLANQVDTKTPVLQVGVSGTKWSWRRPKQSQLQLNRLFAFSQ
jgi:hypothetical protein